MLYEIYQRVVLGIGSLTTFIFIMIGFWIFNQLKFEVFLLILARIIVGWLGLVLFFIFYALSQHTQPDPRKK